MSHVEFVVSLAVIQLSLYSLDAPVTVKTWLRVVASLFFVLVASNLLQGR